MIKIFRTFDNNVHQINEAQEGSWIALIDPTATELVEVAEKYGICLLYTSPSPRD